MISKLATPYKFQSWGAVRWNKRTAPITMIVVHHMATTDFNMAPGMWVAREASAHYGIGPKGEIRAYVDEDNAAWHSSGENNYSIGIECCNVSGAPKWEVSDATFESLVKLCKEIVERRGPLKIVGHRDVGPTECPGPSLYPRLDELRRRVLEPDETAKHKAAIQSKCKFSDPEGVWKYLDQHPYAKDLYKKWAESYK